VFLKQEMGCFFLFASAGTKKRSSGANADGIITIKIEQL